MKHKAGDVMKCKRKGCTGTFLFDPKHKYQKYCSKNCNAIANRQRQKRRYEEKIYQFGKDKYGRFWTNLLTAEPIDASYVEEPLWEQICCIAPRRSHIHV